MNHSNVACRSTLNLNVCVFLWESGRERRKFIIPQGLFLKGWFACWLALVKGLPDKLWCGSALPVVWLARWINVASQMKETAREWCEIHEMKQQILNMINELVLFVLHFLSQTSWEVLFLFSFSIFFRVILWSLLLSLTLLHFGLLYDQSVWFL